MPELSFAEIIALLDGEQVSIPENTAVTILSALDSRIKTFRIANLTAGPDPRGIHTRKQVDSLNHSVIYLLLENNMQVPLSMENDANSKKGMTAYGVLIMKFQTFPTQSWKTLISVVRPWNSLGRIVKMKHLVKLLEVMGAHNFKMHKSNEGCRFWVRTLCEVWIQTAFIDLDVEHKELGWKRISTGSLPAHKKQDKVIAESVVRLDPYFKYWYTSKGEKRVMEMNDGKFDKPMPKSYALLAKLYDLGLLEENQVEEVKEEEEEEEGEEEEEE